MPTIEYTGVGALVESGSGPNPFVQAFLQSQMALAGRSYLNASSHVLAAALTLRQPFTVSSYMQAFRQRLQHELATRQTIFGFGDVHLNKQR